jgi:hypothetical protein
VFFLAKKHATGLNFFFGPVPAETQVSSAPGLILSKAKDRDRSGSLRDDNKKENKSKKERAKAQSDESEEQTKAKAMDQLFSNGPVVQ